MNEKNYNLLSVSFSIEIQESLVNNGFSTGKAISLHAWTGSECSSSLGFPDFKTIDTRKW